MGAFLQVWHWASKGWHSAGFVKLLLGAAFEIASFPQRHHCLLCSLSLIVKSRLQHSFSVCTWMTLVRETSLAIACHEQTSTCNRNMCTCLCMCLLFVYVLVSPNSLAFGTTHELRTHIR